MWGAASVPATKPEPLSSSASAASAASAVAAAATPQPKASAKTAAHLAASTVSSSFAAGLPVPPRVPADRVCGLDPRPILAQCQGGPGHI